MLGLYTAEISFKNFIEGNLNLDKGSELFWSLKDLNISWIIPLVCWNGNEKIKSNQAGQNADSKKKGGIIKKRRRKEQW